ncbi:MAG: type II toxin-antitoxin system RelE/ParE family toxin [Candidatus Riflebacteria bacterium]|nr:type II toxin-antitoxin system RelE/ParE family toxin [Candidatus Riflebacteria bacterium]
MDFEIEKKELIELYTTGKSKKLPPGIAEKFADRIERIRASVTIDDLRVPPSMNFEKMQGHDNTFSIRLNQKYRMIFRVEFADEEMKTGKVFIKEIWDHGKKY